MRRNLPANLRNRDTLWRLGTPQAVLLASAFVAGCASAGSTTRVSSAVRDVSLDARLLAMSDQRRSDTLLLDTLLHDPIGARRARAALAVGQGRITACYPQVRRLLFDGDTAVAANAAYALGIAKDTASVEALHRAVQGAADAVAREAAWSLGEIGEPARAALLRALQPDASRMARDPWVQAAILLAAGKLRPAPAELVIPWLRDSRHEVVRAAAYVVGRNRLTAGVSAIIPLQRHPDEEVRQHVARALARSVVPPAQVAAARAALTVLARDASERVRVNAARSLSSFGAEIEEAYWTLLADSAPNVRMATAESLTVVLGSDAPAYRRAWQIDTMFAMRRTVMQAARRAGLALFESDERAWSTNPDWRYRLAALEARSRAVTGDRISVVREFATDGDARVRASAIGRLPAAATDPSIIALAQAASTDDDLLVRSAAARVLGTVPPLRSPVDSAARVPRPVQDYERLVRQWMIPGAPQPLAIISTEHGDITLRLAAREAPLVVEAFVRLARDGSYRNSTFHRVVPNFVVQDGDLRGDGTGRAGFALRESFSRRRHERGCLGLATSGPDTGGSQYYMCHASQPHLDGGYTVFGQVVEGFDVMDKLVQGDRMFRITIK